MVIGRVTNNADEVAFDHSFVDELALQNSAKLPRPGKQDETARFGVESMDWTVSESQTIKRLWARNLMHQVQINVNKIRLAVLATNNDVVIPYLFGKRTWSVCRRVCVSHIA